MIEKPGQGSLEIQASSEADAFFIDTVNHFKSSSLAADQTAQGDWDRRGLYGGPVFNELDSSVVEQFHKYLEERGFDAKLAAFVPKYLEYKESKEYRRWLDNVSQFVGH